MTASPNTDEILPRSPFNVIVGEPRSITTLQQNIWEQNPEVHVSSTSPLAKSLAPMLALWSGSLETKGDLGRNREQAEKRIKLMATRVIEACHETAAKKKGATVVFDKSRDWLFHLDLLWTAFPYARVLVCLRDPRGVVASYERHYRKNGLLDESSMTGKTLRSRMNILCDPEKGELGGALTGIVDAIDRVRFLKDPRMVVVKAEEFTASTDAAQNHMTLLYRKLGFKDYYDKHQFTNIKNTATDPDYLRLNKVPHDGCGEVRPCPYKWSDYISSHKGGIGDMLVSLFPIFYRKFYARESGLPPLYEPSGSAGADGRE